MKGKCRDCLWWSTTLQQNGWSVCAWLTGSQGAPNVRIQIGSKHSTQLIRTVAGWGCDDFEQRARTTGEGRTKDA